MPQDRTFAEDAARTAPPAIPHRVAPPEWEIFDAARDGGACDGTIEALMDYLRHPRPDGGR